MNEHVIGVGMAAAVVLLLGLAFGLTFYSMTVRQQCVEANAHRTAAEVVVICGRGVIK